MLLSASLALTLVATQALPDGARVDTIAIGLQVPWGIGFAPDG